MPQKIALDIGKQRTGIAITDAMNIIASGLTTVPYQELIPFLKELFSKNDVDVIAMGDPKHLDGSSTDATQLVQKTKQLLEQTFPNKTIVLIDERFTSKLAKDAILQSGAKKKQRRNKALVDQVSATIILQTYLELYNR